MQVPRCGPGAARGAGGAVGVLPAAGCRGLTVGAGGAEGWPGAAGAEAAAAGGA